MKYINIEKKYYLFYIQTSCVHFISNFAIFRLILHFTHCGAPKFLSVSLVKLGLTTSSIRIGP